MVNDGVVYEYFQKMEILGVGYWCDYESPMKYSFDSIYMDYKQCQGRYPTHSQNSDGNVNVNYVYFNDGKLNWNNNWLDNDWDSQNPAAVLATLFISLPFSRESFVFATDRSIHPTFFRFLPMAGRAQYIV